ncbi:MAG: transglycosylase domain-containing protein [Eubacteriales bacterium]|nr:transglycosylase domain-containing protein [Eubacteriales bacterium]
MTINTTEKNTNKNNVNNGVKRKKRTKKKKKFSILRFFLLLIVIAIFAAGGAVIGVVAASVRNAPDIDPTIILSMLSESSTIVDDKGNVIEMIQSTEDRKIITIEEMPDYLTDAFIAIEDHRFEEHPGIDIRRIVGSFIHNIQVGDLMAQGASTITQQLAKNLYLTNDKSFDRKLKEAYLAIEMERKLTKDQILEYYLNTIPLGQSSNGVQAAAFTYFSKDVNELTLAEAALLAGIPKADSRYAAFNRVVTGNDTAVDPDDIVGYVYVSGTQYTCVYNPISVDRQHVVLSRMLELGRINQAEYDTAMAQDIRASLNPGQKMNTEISSYFTDYVKNQVALDLMDEYGYTFEQAENLLYTGGFTIYSTMDFSIQKILENTYANFAEMLLGDLTNENVPYITEWKYFRWNADGKSSGNLDGNDNILNENGHIVYYRKDLIFNEDNQLYLTPDEYEFNENGDLVINSKKFNLYTTTIDVLDLYVIKDNFLSVHDVGGLNIGDNFEILESRANKGKFSIKKTYLDARPEFYTLDENNNLIIDDGYYYFDPVGILQPQSSAVIIDHRTGEIKALIGGRNIEVSKSFNRATRATRQPGSTIKPLSVYLPAIDTGLTAATIIDDVPRYDDKGERWPKNWYENQAYKYWGITNLRKSIEQSLNVNAVYMLERIGFDTSLKYLDKLGLVDLKNPENDDFVTPEENRAYNDLNLAAMALGGLTQGFTNLDMTAAYGAIANNGVYIEPFAYTRVVDRNGKIILDKQVKSNIVVSPQVAFLMQDMLRTTVTNGLSYRAAMPRDYNIEVAGKTGTTSDNADIWYVGFSPYYTGGMWVGNDNSQIKVSTGSGSVSRLWGNIMVEVHKNMPPAEFVRPEGLVSVNICLDSGLLPSELCSHDQRGSRITSELFVRGTEPTTFCDVHVEKTICVGSGLLPGPYCPLDQLETRVFISRAILYNPIYHNTSQTVIDAYEFYNTARDTINNSNTNLTDAQLEALFDNRIQLINGIIVTVDGIAVVDLYNSGMRTQDYQFQVPVNTCTIHNRYHWNIYQQSIGQPQIPIETDPDENETTTETDENGNGTTEETTQNGPGNGNNRPPKPTQETTTEQTTEQTTEAPTEQTTTP